MPHGPRYTDRNRWTPRHYGDELHERGLQGRDEAVTFAGGGPPRGLDTSDRKACNEARVRCPNCGKKRKAASLVDCRHVPDDLSDGARWACDACWMRWIRPSGQSRSGTVWREQRMSEAEWVALHGAPEQVVRQFRQTLQKRKTRGHLADHRITDRIDLEQVPAEPRDPTQLPPLPERAEGRGQGGPS